MMEFEFINNYTRKFLVCLFVTFCLFDGCPQTFAGQLPYTYMQLNPNVVLSQNNGGFFPVGSSFTGARTWSVSDPNQMVLLVSNTVGKYSTLAINRHSTTRYGQILIQLGKDAALWTRIGLFDHNNPQFTSLNGSAGAGADVILDSGAAFSYRSSNALFSPGKYHSTAQFFKITINYDLQAGTYEIWNNSTKIAGPIAFDVPLAQNVEAVGLANTYATGTAISVLKYWHWQTSDTTPFSGVGTIVTSASCGDIWDSGNGILGDLNNDCYTNFIDFALFAETWMKCNEPSDVDCQ
jgi:hypothetical protein